MVEYIETKMSMEQNLDMGDDGNSGGGICREIVSKRQIAI